MAGTLQKPAEASPARLCALAKLPLFFDLAGKPAVVAEGRVFAEALHSEMQALLARDAVADSLRHAGQSLDREALADAAIRRRIEAMLPPALGNWAWLAKRIRGTGACRRIWTGRASPTRARRPWSAWAAARPGSSHAG